MNKPSLKNDDEDLEKSQTGLVDGEVHKDKDGGVVKPQGLRSRVVDVACIGLNIASTVTLVFLNKWYVWGVVWTLLCDLSLTWGPGVGYSAILN